MFVQGQPFRLTDVDLHEVINILNIIVFFLVSMHLEINGQSAY